MTKQPTLRPSDIVVAVQLAITPEAHFLQLAKRIGISSGECHNAVRRLRYARLLLAEERRPSTELLQSFLVHGVPFAFPAVIGPEVVGIPTAHSAPAFESAIQSGDRLVWPHADGPVRGRSVIPLYSGAPELPPRNRALYDLLTLIDALRTGSARVRGIAADMLAERLLAPAQ